ncbi:MAG: hypothetical protein ACI8ZO_001679 [Flavobacteriales bacterium]|jgi:hypothetical protein
MRVGSNPIKKVNTLSPKYRHRVFIPVCIPVLDGYFKDGLSILKLCLESLIITSHHQTAITVIDNNSCVEVSGYLRELLDKGKIQQLVLNNYNAGKMDGVLNLMRGSYEDLLTISDADVLFTDQWQILTEKSFGEYPELGMVCPTPVLDQNFYFTSSNFWQGLFSNKMKPEQTPDLKGLEMFAHSIGKRGNDLKDTMDRNALKLIYQKKGKSKLINGGGHFVATIRREIVESIPRRYSSKAIAGNSVLEFFDEPIDKSGFMRCSLYHSHAFHMGNVLEPWMYEKFHKLISNNTPYVQPIKAVSLWIPYIFRRKSLRLFKFINKAFN